MLRSKINLPFIGLLWFFSIEKGCVIEGAGGFRNQDTAGNVLQHEVIEGMLQLAKDRHYVLLTPLASASGYGTSRAQ